jgi:uncharacterized spore protein YtfJ
MDAQTLLSRVGEALSVRRAFGEPIERNGVVVIPVAFVAGGGGGGEGQSAPAASGSKSEPESDEPDAGSRVDSGQEMGSGGGFGGVVIPLGIYVIKGEDVRWKPVLQPMRLALSVLGLIRLLVKTRSLTSRR